MTAKKKPGRKTQIGRTPRDERTGRVRDPARRVQKGLANTVKDLTQQKMAVELKLRGATYHQIAEHMGVDPRTVHRLVAKGLEEYFADHHEIVHRYVAFCLARNDQLLRTYLPRALGGNTKKRVRDEITGQEVEQVVQVEPDVAAAKVVLDVHKDIERLTGAGAAIRVEHTGAAGGPITTAAVDSMDAARLVREAFGGAAAKSVQANAGGEQDDAAD